MPKAKLHVIETSLSNYLPVSKIPYLIFIKAKELFEDGVGMLAECGGRSPNAWPALRELDRRVDHLDPTTSVMLHFHHHVPSLGVVMVERALHVVDGSVRHPHAFKSLEPLLGCLLNREVFNKLLQLSAVRDPLRVCAELLVVFPLRPADSITKKAKEPVIASAKQDIPVLGLEGPVRDDRGCLKSVI